MDNANKTSPTTDRLNRKLFDRLQIYAQKAIDFKFKMDNAKTLTKKEYYKMKLLKNNKEAHKIIKVMEVLNPTLNNEITDEKY